MGEDWATNSSRPQAMVTDLEDYAHYTALICSNNSRFRFSKELYGSKEIIRSVAGTYGRGDGDHEEKGSLQIGPLTKGSTCCWAKMGICKQI